MMSRFWYTASAVPRYQCSSPTRCWAGSRSTNLVELGAQEAPAALQVAQQRVRLVLRDHADAADARVEAVRQREVDDAELAAEVDRRLGAPVGELLQPRAASAGQHQRGAASAELERFLTRNLVHACHLALPDRRQADAPAVPRSASRQSSMSAGRYRRSIDRASRRGRGRVRRRVGGRCASRG